MIANVRELSYADMQNMLRPRPVDGHKGTFGHALLIAGSKGMAGAAILSAEACLRSGIGKLSILSDEGNREILQITVPEAILQTDGHPTYHYSAVGIGPGLGVNPRYIDQCLSTYHEPMVLDADALNALIYDDLITAIRPNTILTPHPGEASRFIGSCVLEDVAQWAQQHKVYIVLKGHPTHVCTPEGDIYQLAVGNSGMATAGSGDVLTGIITGLLAQGYPPLHASLLGVWIHGRAGDHARDEMGENCMLARDIIGFMPEAFREMTIIDNV